MVGDQFILNRLQSRIDVAIADRSAYTATETACGSTLSPPASSSGANCARLTEEDESLTERGRTIFQHTPAGRFGEPEELVGTIVWMCSPAVGFVNGVVVLVNGGFGAFSQV